MTNLLQKLSIITVALLVVYALSSPAYALDTDCDGVDDSVDNCIDAFNPTQGDLDNDETGDKCDADKDGDEIDNVDDNCPREVNDLQEDADGDGVGDACDQCPDEEEGVVNGHGCTIDGLCPCDGPAEDEAWRNHRKYVRCVKNKARNFRRKRLIDREERREIIVAAKESACGDIMPVPGDFDGDRVLNDDDNCPVDPNPSQRNTDGDEFGNACDDDKDDDAILNRDDNCPLVANADGQAEDADGDGAGDACDACAGSGLADPVDRSGCSIDQNCPCEVNEDGEPWRSHGKYVRCVKDEARRFRRKELITPEERDLIEEAAAASSCGAMTGICE